MDKAVIFYQNTCGPKTDLLQVARNTQNRYMGKLYQGSDDVWKTYSWEMELGKLKNVFKKDPNATISLRDAKSRIELSEQGNKSRCSKNISV